MSKDPREAIERAAREHRKGPDPSVRAANERAARRTMLEESLWEASGGSLLLILALMVMLGASLGVAFGVVPQYTQQGVLIVLAGVAAFVGSIFFVLSVGSRALTAWHARSVRRIGHGFDAEAYLEQLSKKRRSGRLIATLHFDAGWEHDLRRSTTDAVRTWCPDLESARWEGDRALHLETAQTTLVKSYRKNKSYVTAFTNYPLHACMKNITHKVLPQLNAVHAVTRIEVRITGNECAFDEQP